MKKLLFVLPAVVLLAAACSSPSNTQTGASTNTAYPTGVSPTGVAATPTPSATAMPTAMAPSSSSNIEASSSMGTDMNMSASSTMGSVWQGTLQLSNDSTKGNYMLVTGGHTVYFNTSHDYSAMVGQSVNLNYTGSMSGFTINGITAASGSSMSGDANMSGQATSSMQMGQ